eukprot:1147622-Prorocentrum_minimum.AAC.1
MVPAHERFAVSFVVCFGKTAQPAIYIDAHCNKLAGRPPTFLCLKKTVVSAYRRARPPAGAHAKVRFALSEHVRRPRVKEVATRQGEQGE